MSDFRGKCILVTGGTGLMGVPFGTNMMEAERRRKVERLAPRAAA